ncbi:hypothetical protein T05_10962 [Trichinella murrelli]|uniref:Uncharacterized protein n=1 Tax=Trichinella murrelli TaxID=144512 RepID=A0A0V0T3E9_9BILA|nr:hypothetical protein T05_10962 [Trichinella murrelli]
MLDGLFSLTPNMIAWHGIFQLLDGRGGVSLSISSNICPSSLFSLTPNVIGRYGMFNCSMVSFRSRRT